MPRRCDGAHLNPSPSDHCCEFKANFDYKMSTSLAWAREMALSIKMSTTKPELDPRGPTW